MWSTFTDVIIKTKVAQQLTDLTTGNGALSLWLLLKFYA